MPMYSAGGNAVLPALGFPIRESADQWLFSAYPRLFAAVHALLRLLVPRHPPCALLILTVIRHSPDPKILEAPGDTRCLAAIVATAASWHGCAVFKVREEARAPDWGARSLKTQQHPPAGDPKAVWSRKRLVAGARPGRRSGSRSSSSSAVCDGRAEPTAPFLELPRKEVIQPHLPVRLPCYDFTPVTSPTFDGSLPKG